MKGKFVLVPFPYTDLTASKLRPALVIYEGRRDVVVSFVSSRISTKPPCPSIEIAEGHPEFELTGLKMSSIIRLDKVATVLKDIVVGELGEAGPRLTEEINEKLAEIYRL
jgi:mRNA interferase MazF